MNTEFTGNETIEYVEPLPEPETTDARILEWPGNGDDPFMDPDDPLKEEYYRSVNRMYVRKDGSFNVSQNERSRKKWYELLEYEKQHPEYKIKGSDIEPAYVDYKGKKVRGIGFTYNVHFYKKDFEEVPFAEYKWRGYDLTAGYRRSRVPVLGAYQANKDSEEPIEVKYLNNDNRDQFTERELEFWKQHCKQYKLNFDNIPLIIKAEIIEYSLLFVKEEGDTCTEGFVSKREMAEFLSRHADDLSYGAENRQVFAGFHATEFFEIGTDKRILGSTSVYPD